MFELVRSRPDYDRRVVPQRPDKPVDVFETCLVRRAMRQRRLRDNQKPRLIGRIVERPVEGLAVEAPRIQPVCQQCFKEFTVVQGAPLIRTAERPLPDVRPGPAKPNLAAVQKEAVPPQFDRAEPEANRRRNLAAAPGIELDMGKIEIRLADVPLFQPAVGGQNRFHRGARSGGNPERDFAAQKFPPLRVGHDERGLSALHGSGSVVDFSGDGDSVGGTPDKQIFRPELRTFFENRRLRDSARPRRHRPDRKQNPPLRIISRPISLHFDDDFMLPARLHGVGQQG